MKNVSPLFFIWIGFWGLCQEGVYNTGMMRIYADGGMGLHTDLVNDGIFDDNLGLMGFYSDDVISVSGNFVPTFYDMEVFVANGLDLKVSVAVENNHTFVQGNITTPRNTVFTSLSFRSDAFHVGAADIGKVDGYVTMYDQQNFVFPVGDTEQLRPLVLHSEYENQMATCAYYVGDPNDPKFLSMSFNTDSKESGIRNISTREFWHLQGTVPSTVQISWNPRSAMDFLTGDVDEIVLVGWHRSTRQWENLGGNAIGDLAQGFVVSGHFIPEEYEVITFGTSYGPEFIADLPNYLVTPNGDGINDFLEIPELGLFPNNHVRIYDRYGLIVFEKSNYTNEFKGYATEGNMVINRSKGLPSGVYFYLVSIPDSGMEHQGFLYLRNN